MWPAPADLMERMLGKVPCPHSPLPFSAGAARWLNSIGNLGAKEGPWCQPCRAGWRWGTMGLLQEEAGEPWGYRGNGAIYKPIPIVPYLGTSSSEQTKSGKWFWNCPFTEDGSKKICFCFTKCTITISIRYNCVYPPSWRISRTLD